MRILNIAILFILLFSCAEDTSYPKTKNYERSLRLYRGKKYEEAKEIARLILTSSFDPHELAHANLLLAYANFRQDSLKQAYFSCKKAKDYFLALGDKFYITKSYNRLGLVFYELRSYAKALDYFELALDYAITTGNENHLANNLYGIGRCHKHLGNYELALKNLLKARVIEQNLEQLKYFIDIQLEIGIVQRMAGNHQLAIDHCWQVMNSATGTPYENLFKGKAYNNLGYTYFELGDYQKAEQYLTQSLNYTDRGDTFVAATYNNLGSVYNELGNHTKASACFQKSVELNQHKVDMEELIFTFNSIRSLPEVKSNNDSLIYYMDLFAAIAAPTMASKESLERKDLRYRLEGLELAEIEKASRDGAASWTYLLLVINLSVLVVFTMKIYKYANPMKYRYFKFKKHMKKLKKEDVQKKKETSLDHKKTVEKYLKDLDETRKLTEKYKKN